MSIFHDKFLDDLPIGWGFDRLKDIVSLRNEKTAEVCEEQDYLELEDLESGTGRIINRRNTLEVESTVTLFKKNDILFGKLRPYLEKYWQAEFDGKCTGEILAFEPQRIFNRFLFYCIGSQWFIERCNALAYGAKMPRVNWATQLSQFNIPLPPFPEQKLISAYLDSSCTAIDASVAAKRRQIEALKTLLTSLITQSVVHGLDQNTVCWNLKWPWFKGVPKHWRYGHLKRFTTRIQTGVTPPTEHPEYYEDGTIPWFAPGSYDGDLELYSPRKLINEAALHDGVLRMFPVRTIFFIGIGATIGKVGMVTMPASCNQQIIGIVVNHDLLPKYLAYQMKIYENIISGIAIATTLPIFDQAKTGYLPVVIPPMQEQKTICNYLDAKTNESKQTIATIEFQIDTLTAYRKSLIHECVTGQRRITEADVNRAIAARQS